MGARDMKAATLPKPESATGDTVEIDREQWEGVLRFNYTAQAAMERAQKVIAETDEILEECCEMMDALAAAGFTGDGLRERINEALQEIKANRCKH
jgi:hypothetical protein